MRKIIIAVLLSIAGVNACDCQTQIDQIFAESKQYIQKGLEKETEAIYDLAVEVSNALMILFNQNMVLQKAINAEKQKAKQNQEIIFLLEKLNNLQ